LPRQDVPKLLLSLSHTVLTYELGNPRARWSLSQNPMAGGQKEQNNNQAGTQELTTAVGGLPIITVAPV